jgi:UDP-N-acetylglucosamine/UDP-N-acetylgalactosamine diphosphorylase
MVSDTNKEETRAFFAENGFFGLNPADVTFFTQRMVPCVDEAGKFILEDRASLAMNPNGHGGSIPALVDNGIIADAKARGIDTLTYFQVDNLAAKVADPLFIGYHIQRNAEMSSKCHRKNKPREAVGVHCICDGGEYRVIEYTELDIYPQLLETDDTGEVVYYAGNPAIHILSTGFVERIYNEYDQFPWHRAHKKISFVNDAGEKVSPEKPNGYKFETFVFDALRFVAHEPVALEMGRAGEYTPIKQFEGDNSVVAAWNAMRAYWGEWLEAAGCVLPRNADGAIAAKIEISPEFALTKDEFVAKTAGYSWPAGDIGIAADGSFIRPCNG